MGIEQLKVRLNHYCGDDLTTVNAARVSFDKSSDWGEMGEGDFYTLSPKDEKLIHYLAKHKHISPFGHCFASFTIEAPVFVARQLVKHRFLRMNEVSRRYVDTPPELYTPDMWRGKPVNKKQGSAGVVEDVWYWAANAGEQSLNAYDELIGAGVAPEMARMVLPQSMMTQWWHSGSLDAFAAMCILRCKDDTQWETRQIADQISKEMENLFPVSWKALMDNA